MIPLLVAPRFGLATISFSAAGERGRWREREREREARGWQRSFDPRHSVSANRNSTGERSHRALIPHANFRKRARPRTTPSRPPRPSRFPSSRPPRARVIARYIAFRTNRYPVRTLYASLPPSLSHIDKSAAEQISNLLLDRLLPPPSSFLVKTRKLKARASSVSYQSSSAFTDRSLLPPALPITSFPSTDLPLPRVSPRDSFPPLPPFLPQHSFTPARYTYNEEVHRDAGSNTRRCDRVSFFPFFFPSPLENLFSVNYGLQEGGEDL